MDQAFWLIALIVFAAAGLISIFTIVNLLLPVLVERSRAALEVSIGRSLVLGLINSVLAAVLIYLLSLPTHAGGVVAGIFGVLIGIVALAVLALLLLGLVSTASLLGSKLGGSTVITSHLRGGGLLVLACLTPYIGWFGFTPLVAWASLGAAIQAVFRRSPAAPAVG